MKPEQLSASFKEILLSRQAELQNKLINLRGGDISRAEASAEHFGNTGDSSAKVNAARDLEFTLEEHESAELDLVAIALERIEAGTYGECVDCGVDIPVERLKVAPTATRCIACQEKVESAQIS